MGQAIFLFLLHWFLFWIAISLARVLFGLVQGFVWGYRLPVSEVQYRLAKYQLKEHVSSAEIAFVLTLVLWGYFWLST